MPRHFWPDRLTTKVAAKKQGQLYGLLFLMFKALLVCLVSHAAKMARACCECLIRQSVSQMNSAEWKLKDNQSVRYRVPRICALLVSTFYPWIQQRQREIASVFIGTDDRLRRHRSLLSDKNGYQDGIGISTGAL